MSMLRCPRWVGGTVLCLMVGVGSASAQNWQTSQLFSDAGDPGELKGSCVVGSASGGFHGVYSIKDQGVLKYKRYNGTLGASVVVPGSSGFVAGHHMAEAPNGDIHIVWENWHAGPEMGWSRSTNGGASFSSTVEITSTGMNMKWPYIAGFGLAGSDDVVVSYWRSDNRQMRSLYYNGSSWGADTYMGVLGNSQYEVNGIARSPLDGSVWRTYTTSGALKLRQYTGSGWGAEITLDSNGEMHNRQRVAVNDAGQVMVIWDEDDVYYSILYTPGVGAGAKTVLTSSGSWAKDVCAIPGSNNFYAVYWHGSHARLYGRKWAGAGWLSAEHVSYGLADNFIADASVDADPAGNIYCMFEYWSDGPPDQYYNVRPATPPGPTGTLTGTVRDQYGVGVSGALVTVQGYDAVVSGSGGTYTMTVPTGGQSVQVSKDYFFGQTLGVTIYENQTTVQDFAITGQVPGLVSQFVATPSSEANLLTWQNPSSGNYSGAMVRYRTDTYPTSPTDGALAVDLGGDPGAGSSFNHAGLTNGQTYYYGVWAYFQDASRYYAGRVMTTGTPAGDADLDRDGDVDMDDYAAFQVCMTGLAVPQNDPDCLRTRLDGDTDVDEFDLDLFLGCLSGVNVPSVSDCAQ